VSELRHSWQRWADARAALEQARQALDNAKAEEDWLRDAVEVLDQLAPQAGEEDSLITERTRLANVSKIGEGIAQAEDALFGDVGAQNALGTAINAIEKAAELAGGPLDETLAALQRAEAEFAEASSLIHAASDSLEANPGQLEQLDDRLHAFVNKPENIIVILTIYRKHTKNLLPVLLASKTSPARLAHYRTPPRNGKNATRH